MIDKKAINYYSSFYEVSKDLTKEQFYNFNMAIFKVMFFDEHIDNITFKDSVLNLIWKSVKHSIQSSVEGYCSKKNIPYNECFATLDNPLDNPLDNKNNKEEQEKEKVKGKAKKRTIDELSGDELITLKKNIDSFIIGIENTVVKNNVEMPPITEYDDFILTCKSKGYSYVDFFSAYQIWHRGNVDKWKKGFSNGNK